jgi:hypothetical protein
MKFHIYIFFETLSRKLKFHYNRTRITGTLREELCTYFISRGILFTMRNVSDESYRANSKHTFDVQLLFLINYVADDITAHPLLHAG